jgi:hypothetical protein
MCRVQKYRTKKQQWEAAVTAGISYRRYLPGLVGLAFALLLAACAGAPPVPAPAPQPVAAPQPSPDEKRQRAIAYFLARAEAAMEQGMLTEPAGASAYDFYLNVRHFDPDNRRAASGIQSIVLQLVDQAREALRSRAFGRVNSLLNTAEQLAPDNPLSAELRKQLAREQSHAQENSAQVDMPGAETVSLPAAELSAKSAQVISLLQATAERIRQGGLRVIIVARNDAEGRWIYGQLREAVPEYRVRGDIKLGSPPKLLLARPEGE